MPSVTGLSPYELATILEHLPSGVIVVDAFGRDLFRNSAARSLRTPYQSPHVPIMDRAVRAGMRDAQTGRVLERQQSPLARALTGEVVAPQDYLVATTDSDDLRRLRVSAIPVRNECGEISGAVSVFTDITDEVAQKRRAARLFEVEQRARAQTEQAMAQLEQELIERRRAEDALQRSQQRLRLALEASRMGTWDYDALTRAVDISPEMASLTGSTRGAAQHALVDALARFHPDDRASVEAALENALAEQHDLHIETRIVDRSNDRVRWLLIKGRVFRDQAGRPLRMTGIGMEITERKEAEAARTSMAHGERLRALGEMASGIAHDLNQSLALITGYSDMIRQELVQGVPEVNRVREMVDITSRAAFQGGKALRGLLSFVRTQDLMAEIERINVAEVLEDIALLTAPRWRDYSQAQGRPIMLDVTAEGGCWINGSPAELREALTNLVFNAVDALPAGGSIHLRAWRAGEHVAIEVADTGTGMTPEVKARVFDPFFTTKGEQGTGLGLPQVLAIVEKHGGSIDLQSSPGVGTHFCLKFPRASEPAQEKAPDLTDRPAAKPQRGVRVLIVEDEDQLARMARLVFSQHGHQVVVASSGEAAVEQLAHQTFDLVVSDLGLGAGKNGWDVAEEVRRRSPSARFVLVTGWGAAIDPQEAAQRGVHEVIAKPYRIADLRQVADRVANALGDD